MPGSTVPAIWSHRASTNWVSPTSHLWEGIRLLRCYIYDYTCEKDWQSERHKERERDRERVKEREKEVDTKNTKIKMRWMKIKISNLGICFQTGKINKNIIILNNI